MFRVSVLRVDDPSFLTIVSLVVAFWLFLLRASTATNYFLKYLPLTSILLFVFLCRHYINVKPILFNLIVFRVSDLIYTFPITWCFAVHLVVVRLIFFTFLSKVIFVAVVLSRYSTQTKYLSK